MANQRSFTRRLIVRFFDERLEFTHRAGNKQRFNAAGHQFVR